MRRIRPPAIYLLVVAVSAGAVVAVIALHGRFDDPVTLRILYTGDTVGYLEPCG